MAATTSSAPDLMKAEMTAENTAAPKTPPALMTLTANPADVDADADDHAEMEEKCRSNAPNQNNSKIVAEGGVAEEEDLAPVNAGRSSCRTLRPRTAPSLRAA